VINVKCIKRAWQDVRWFLILKAALLPTAVLTALSMGNDYIDCQSGRLTCENLLVFSLAMNFLGWLGSLLLLGSLVYFTLNLTRPE